MSPKCSSPGVRHATQKQHWLNWLREYDRPGYYKRKTWNHSAEYAYNHIVCPYMLLWLAEASGIHRNRVLGGEMDCQVSGTLFRRTVRRGPTDCPMGGNRSATQPERKLKKSIENRNGIPSSARTDSRTDRPPNFCSGCRRLTH